MSRAFRIERQPGRSYSIPMVLAVSLAAIFALYVLSTELAYAGRVYPGVAAYGVDLSGKTIEQATQDLRARFAAYGRQHVVVQAADQHLDLTTADLGFRPRADVLARASYEVGRDGTLLQHLAGPWLASRLAPSVAFDQNVDEQTLIEAVDRIAARVDQPRQEPSLVIGATISVRPGRVGTAVDRTKARDLIRQYLNDLRLGPLTIPVERTPPRVTDATVQQLRDRAEEIVSQPLVVRSGNRQWTLTPDRLRSALGYQSNPPALTLDRRAFDDTISRIASQIERPPRDASISIVSGKVSIVADEDGLDVDRSATLRALENSVLSGQHAVVVVVTPRAPSVRAADLKDLASQAQRLIDQGVTLEAGGFQYRIAGTRLGDLIHASGERGRPGLALDETRLAQTIAEVNAQFRRPTPRTRFTWSNGQVAFLGPSRSGLVIDQTKAIQAVMDHWRDGEVKLPVAESPTALDDDYLARLRQDLKGVIEDRATSFAGSIPERAHNIALAAQRLNGVVVAPGQIFSFNQTIGPTTLQAGYQWGFAFSTDSDGSPLTVPSVAGGLCQVASTVFQPVFWAGYEIEERHNHMFWMRLYKDRGYLGLDATVSPADGVDLKFKNDSPHALLIQSWTEGEQIHVQLIGTRPDWQVQVDPERITDVVPAPTRVLRTTSPLFQKGRVIVLEEAQTGLTSHVTRRVIYPDGHVRTLNLESVYQPANAAVLVGTG